jgi:hypothetical protein
LLPRRPISTRFLPGQKIVNMWRRVLLWTGQWCVHHTKQYPVDRQNWLRYVKEISDYRIPH